MVEFVSYHSYPFIPNFKFFVTIQYVKTHMGTDTLVSASRQQVTCTQVLRPE